MLLKLVGQYSRHLFSCGSCPKIATDYETKRTRDSSWASAATIVCHIDQCYYSLFSCAHPSVSLSAFIGCASSHFTIQTLEHRFLVGFTVRLPKYNNNNSRESERRLAQHVSPTNRRFIVSVVLFITTTPLTERVCCQHNWSVFSISQHEISLEICWMNRTLSSQLKRLQYSF